MSGALPGAAARFLHAHAATPVELHVLLALTRAVDQVLEDDV